MKRVAEIILILAVASIVLPHNTQAQNRVRERILINDGWRFFIYDSLSKPDDLIYDVRPEITDAKDDKSADAQPTQAIQFERKQQVLKPWILPTGNEFLVDITEHFVRPKGNPGGDFPFVKQDFHDDKWERVNLPHDWAIKGPFLQGPNAKVGGGMGRLPSPGVAWYRKKLTISPSDAGKSIFLDIDGAMSYAMVWVNGNLVGGWPYGYASWRLDITSFVKQGSNQIAIRLDNPANSSRWYTGGGIYRNVWLTKVSPIHISNWGTYVTTKDVSAASATIDVELTLDNKSSQAVDVAPVSEIYVTNNEGKAIGKAVGIIEFPKTAIAANTWESAKGTVTIKNPKLWGPPPTQIPNRYLISTILRQHGKIVDDTEVLFGVRSLKFDPEKGLFVNGERVYLRGVNQHHDLGALGAAFNTRAAERQLEILREMGCNAIRMAHNPPAPELLELTDRMGFLVIDEIFDGWERKKTPHDFHLIFPDWYEQDLRAFVRRDRNHPSVIMWSYGNEVGEQYSAEAGAKLATKLRDIVKSEDATRPTTLSMNYAKPDMPLPAVAEVIGLNYQGEGIRDAPEYSHLQGIRTSPLFPAFHQKFPDKMIVSSENAAAVSSRGEYTFPVSEGISAPVSDGVGGDSKNHHVSSYELYTVPFGSSVDKVFASEDNHPYVSGGFAWSGWDYIGEPTPYYYSRSSYFGIIDLAGFKKDRFFLYQSRFRPDFPMAHILPHWNWPERVGQITPVHVFTTGDEAELFLNGKSLGRKKKQTGEYRIRWNDVQYAPGELKVIAYRAGKTWAEEIIKTTGAAARLIASADRSSIKNDGNDLSFITVRITDANGLTDPRAKHAIKFSIEGPGEIVATDNGDPTDFTVFPSHSRKAFNGLCLVIVRSLAGKSGTIKLKAESNGLQSGVVDITTQ
jgi:beta-galactosidase